MIKILSKTEASSNVQEAPKSLPQYGPVIMEIKTIFVMASAETIKELHSEHACLVEEKGLSDNRKRKHATFVYGVDFCANLLQDPEEAEADAYSIRERARASPAAPAVELLVVTSMDF